MALSIPHGARVFGTSVSPPNLPLCFGAEWVWFATPEDTAAAFLAEATHVLFVEAGGGGRMVPVDQQRWVFMETVQKQPGDHDEGVPEWQWPGGVFPPSYRIVRWRRGTTWYNRAPGVAFHAGGETTMVAETAQDIMSRVKLAIPGCRIMQSSKGRLYIHDGSVFPLVDHNIVLAPGP